MIFPLGPVDVTEVTGGTRGWVPRSRTTEETHRTGGLMRSQSVRSVALSAGVIVCAAAAVACSSQDPTAPASQASPPQSRATPPPSSAAPSPTDAAKEQAKAAYVGMWQAMARAGETSNWQAPELAQYATANALTTITRSIYTDHFNHVVSRGTPKNYPQVTSAEPSNAPDTVMISDCGDSSGTSKVREGTNDPINDTPGGRRAIVAEVKKQADGTWRVNQFAVQGVGSC